MTVTKNIHGNYIISDIINGHLVTMTYIGYTKKQAIKMFREERRRERENERPC